MATSKGKGYVMKNGDWQCRRCCFVNHSWREYCLQCDISYHSSKQGDFECDEFSIYPTPTIMLKNLDPLTEEMTVSSKLYSLLPDRFHEIQTVKIPSAEGTIQTSRGIAMIIVANENTASALCEEIKKKEYPLIVDGREVTIMYSRFHMGDYSKPYPWEMTRIPIDMEKMAKIAAGRYAGSRSEYLQLLPFYRAYYSSKEKIVPPGTE